MLQGDAGLDSLYEGEGADIFVISKNDEATDNIFDFEDGTDRILLQNGASFFDVTLDSSDGGFSTSISVFGNTVAKLTGVDSGTISEADFVL